MSVDCDRLQSNMSHKQKIDCTAGPFGSTGHRAEPPVHREPIPQRLYLYIRRCTVKLPLSYKACMFTEYLSARVQMFCYFKMKRQRWEIDTFVADPSNHWRLERVLCNPSDSISLHQEAEPLRSTDTLTSAIISWNLKAVSEPEYMQAPGSQL